MNPLQAVEDILGNVGSRPTYAIYNIFIEEPCPRSIKKVAAFMCGNGVPLDIAVECFNVCSGLHSSLVSQTMNKWYCTWDSHPHKKHKAAYYSMLFKRMATHIWRSGVARGYRHAIWHRRNRVSSIYKKYNRSYTCKEC